MRGARLVARGSVVAFVIFVIWSVLAVTDGRWELAVLAAALWIVTSMGSPLIGLAGAIVGIYVGDELLTVAFAILTVLGSVARVLPMWALRPAVDPALLTAAVDAVDPATAGRLRALAGTEPISTTTMLAAAGSGSGPSSRPAWDGPVLRDVNGRAWTAVAAEAVVLGRMIEAEAEDLPTLRALAAAALLLPESAAATSTTADEATPAALSGLSDAHLIELTQAFGKGPAGGDTVRRAELRLTVDPDRSLPPEVLFGASPARLVLFRIGMGFGAPFLYVAAVLAVIRDSVRGRGRHPRQQAGSRPAQRRASGPAQPRATEPAKPRANGPVERPERSARLARLRGWLREAARSTSWSAAIGLHVVRPLLTVAVAALAVVMIRPWWAGALAALGLLLLRPLRRWWLDVALIGAAVAAGQLPVAIVLTVRAAITGVVLVRHGTEAAVAVPRRVLVPSFTGAPGDRLEPPDVVWARYMRGLGDDDNIGDDGAEYLLAVAAGGDGLALGAAVVTVIRIEFFGWRPVAGGKPSYIRRMLLLAMMEWVADRVPRYTMVAAAATVAWATAPAGEWTVGPVRFSFALLTLVLGAVLALLTVRRKPAYKSAGILAAGELWWLGTAVLPTWATVLVGAVVGWVLRRALERRAVSAPVRLRWVGRRVVGVRRHARYRAAALLAARGRPGIAAEMLADIADETRDRRPAAAAAALAQRALVELDRGHLQRAVESAEDARTTAARGKSRTATALAGYASGIVEFGVGDYAEAVGFLLVAEPSLRRRPEGSACGSVLAQAYAALGATDDALAAAARTAGRPFAPGQLPALITSQIAGAWALLRDGRPEEVVSLLKHLPDQYENPAQELGAPADDRTRELWLRLTGEMCLLLGRAHLEAGDLDAAHAGLERAVQQLRRTSATDLLGIARIYQGQYHRLRRSWRAGRTNVQAGVQLLESRRGQLRAGTNRATAVLSGTTHYDIALAVLADAQRHGDTEAGTVAASLIESLRRNAFAATLRDEHGTFAERFSPQARAALDRIAALELAVDADGRARPEQDDDVAELADLRRRLEAEVSRGFAEAYLPEEVDYLRLTATARDAHILQYEFLETGPHRWRGYRVWVEPGEPPGVQAVTVEDAEVLELLRATRLSGTPAAFLDPYDETTGLWAALARDLLPETLIETLTTVPDEEPVRLLVVPGEHLAYLPWAPLLLDETDAGSMLLHKAVIQIVPSLNLLRPRQRILTDRTVLSYLDDQAAAEAAGSGAEAEVWRRLNDRLSIVRVHSQKEFEDNLSDPRFGGIYLIAHGDGTGLSQGIQFSDGGVLSAASALRFRWPPSMVFASCFVAKVEQRSGHEPFGLVIACMLGGCRTVIGGVIKVERQATGEIAADVAVDLARSVHPATALRDAQRRFLDEVGPDAFTNEWGGLICISTEW